MAGVISHAYINIKRMCCEPGSKQLGGSQGIILLQLVEKNKNIIDVCPGKIAFQAKKQPSIDIK